MSLISAVQAYLKTYSSLKSGAPVWVDNLGPSATEYSVVALPGQRIIETYLDGTTIREFPFAFQSMESTADDPERLAIIGFYEAFANWLEAQPAVGVLPSLGVKQTAEKIEATVGGYLMQQGESGTGVYQISCKLTYQQQP